MNTNIKKTVAALVAAGALAVPAAASAHVTVQPESVPAGAFERLDVRVPNESDKAATTKIEVEVPDGIIFLSTEPVPGWEATVKKEKLDEPIEAFGEEYTEQIGTVTFEATDSPGIEPGQFIDFGLSVGLPDAPGEVLEFPAIQTYSDGEVAKWIGPEDSDDPAPLVSLTEAEAEHGSDPTASTAEPVADTDSASDDDSEDGGSDTLAIVALIVGILGLISGLYAASVARKRG